MSETFLLPQTKTILASHFNIIDIIDLNHYTRSPNLLLARLQKNVKKIYHSTDRFIFLLEDHDFYLDGKGPGFILYNLQLSLAYLNIPNYFCLLLTGQPNYNDYTEYVCKQLTCDTIPIRSINTMLFESFVSPAKKRNINEELIKKSFCVLSRVERSHRTYFMSKLFEEHLENQGIIGYNNLQISVETKKNTGEEVNYNLGFLTCPDALPPMILFKEHNRNVFEKFKKQYNNFKNFTEETDLFSQRQSAEIDSRNPIQRGLVYVGLETFTNLEKIFISRISFRGFVENRPFVLLAIPGSLNFLREQGFKTFNNFWDEDYDLITDFETRVDHIISILKDISNKNLLMLIDKMRPLIVHNHNYYHNDFALSEQKKLSIACINNLKGLY
jgi:hypothetical protein